MDIFTWTMVISIVTYVAIGNHAGRGIKELDDYYVAGRRAPTLLIVGTLVASVNSATLFLGEAGFTYGGQMGPFLLFPQISAVGYILGALLFGRYLRRSRAPTVADFFGRRFDSRRVQIAAGATIIVALGGYLVVVTQGAAILLSELTALSYTQALIVAWLSYTAFTMYSGSRGVILTDTIMFLLFTIASLVAVAWILAGFGGLSATIARLASQTDKVDIASWHGTIGAGTEWPTATDRLTWELIIDIAWALVFAVSPWQSSRHLMARNEHVVVRSSIYACLAVGIVMLAVYGMGGFINVANPRIEPAETAILWASKHLMPPFVGALLVAGIMAAALSSASTFLSLVGFSASNDIVQHREASERQALRVSRLVMLAVGIVALLATFIFPPSIFWVTYFVATVFASSWGPVGLMSIWSKRITKDGAFWGMITGFVCNVVPTALDFTGVIDLPSYLNPILIGAVISLIVTTAVSRFGTVTAAEASYRMQLHRMPEPERNLKETKRTLVAPLTLVAYGCVMPLALQHWYVKPYQRATGQLMADGSINWATGEAILSLSWALLYVPLGLISYKVIRHSYGQPRN